MTNKFETTDLNKETFSLQELLESAAKHAASLENANYSEEEFVAKFEGVVNYTQNLTEQNLEDTIKT